MFSPMNMLFVFLFDFLFDTPVELFRLDTCNPCRVSRCSGERLSAADGLDSKEWEDAAWSGSDDGDELDQLEVRRSASVHRTALPQ